MEPTGNSAFNSSSSSQNRLWNSRQSPHRKKRSRLLPESVFLWFQGSSGKVVVIHVPRAQHTRSEAVVPPAQPPCRFLSGGFCGWHQFRWLVARASRLRERVKRDASATFYVQVPAVLIRTTDRLKANYKPWEWNKRYVVPALVAPPVTQDFSWGETGGRGSRRAMRLLFFVAPQERRPPFNR